MTVPSTPRRSPVYTGNGSATAYPFGFKVFAATDIQVIVTSVAGVISAAVLNVDYTVALNADQTTSPGGTINMAAAPAVGVKLVAIGNLPYDQTLSIPGGGNFNPVAIENAFDRTEIQIQQIAAAQAGSITVPIGEVVPPLPAAAVRAGYTLGFDSLGNPIAVAPVSGSVGTLAADLADSATPSKNAGQVGFNYALAYGANTIGKWLKDLATTAGAGLIGVLDTPNYFTSAVLEAVLLELANGKNQFQVEGVNVLRYIPPAEWPAIVNYTSTTNLYTYLQSAHTAEKNLIYPDGRFNTGTKLILRTDAKVRGINRRGPQLRATANVSIFELPYLGVDVDIERLFFCSNANNTGTGVSVAATAGAFQGYAIGLRVHDCDFARELSYGMDIDPIVCIIEKNSFGTDTTTGYAPAAGASTFVALRARQYPATSNATNVNCFRRNKVFYAGSLTVAGIQLSAGANWVVEGNDIEQGGVVLNSNDVSRLDFIQNWLEGNVVTNELIVINGSATTYTEIDNNHIAGNTVGAGRGIINYASTVPTRLDIHGNDFGKNSGSYVLYDNATTLTTLPASGIVAFWDNTVSGDTVGDKCVTGTEFRGGKTSPRLSLCGDTTVTATIFDSNDPGATIVRNSAGSVTITGSHPFATTINKIRAHCTGHAAEECRVLRTAVNQVTVNLFNGANAPTDGAFTLTVWGS